MIDMIVGDCPDCLIFWETLPSGFIMAAASVGIERGLSTRETVAAYISAYHVRGHRPALDVAS
jgi:hypothetical protein